ncbi:MAG: hypothetical protein WCK73_13660 [Deltaproteobacteria bacterium]
MRIASHDRGEILALAGFQHLSPAIRDGKAVLVGEGENTGRVGWDLFFASLDRAGLELAWATEDAASVAAMRGGKAA